MITTITGMTKTRDYLIGVNDLIENNENLRGVYKSLEVFVLFD